MRVAIIALILSIAALGLASFATFAALDSDDPAAPIAAESGWSEAECEWAEAEVNPGGLLWKDCRVGPDQNCAPYNEMLQAIANNCP